METAVSANPVGHVSLGRTQRSKPAFHGGHFSLMAGSALLLIVLGLSQAPAFWHADAFAKKYSGNNLYSNANPSELPSTQYTQYALSQGQGSAGGASLADSGSGAAVLGASTYDTSIPAQFSSLPIATSQDNSAAAIQAYADQANVVLANENTSNATRLHTMKLVQDLEAISVPSSIADYHRLLVETFVLRANGDPQNLAAEITPVMQTISASVQGSANVALPVAGT